MKKLYFLLLSCSFGLFSYSQVFITEIADPNNNADARYIELYNAGGAPVDFTEGNGWQIDKYLNGNVGVNATLDLTGSIPAGGFYIIAYDVTPGTFASVYGFAPDQLDAVSNGVAGSNGDDDLALVDGSDTIVDFFGVYDFGTPLNTDNSGTCAEYEDGRAERLTSVTMGSTTFNEAEWNVWADSDVMGCTSHLNAPRTAPGDFDPGAWGTPTCGLSLTNPSSSCDAITSGTDTYTATVDFIGGGTATYTVTASAGSVDLSGGNPTTDSSGTITVTGLTEGVDVTINVDDGSICDVDSVVFAPDCIPTLALPITETFDYSDGSLTSNANWSTHSGNAGDLLVASGQAVVTHGVPSEDANIEFTPISGNIYFSFEFSVDDLGAPYSNAGTDFEYFAHFNSNPNPFVARLDIVPPTAGGDYTVGISSLNSTADVTWATDLTYATTYHVIVRFNQDENIAELWIDATSDTDPSILGVDEAGTTTVSSFALRQSDSDENETIRVDNLRIADNFARATLSDEGIELTNFSLYPNPTSTGEVRINSVNPGLMDVVVYDILGKQVKRETITNSLDVSTLRSGVYILKITQNEATTTKKLVIR